MDRNLLKLFSNLRSSEMRQLSELLMEPSRSATTQLVLEAQRPGSRGLAAMARLRSASECSLESVESDSDGGFKPGQSAECSDTESDIEMEVSDMIVMMT